MAVIVAISAFKDTALNGLLSIWNLPNNSPAKCNASEAEPPFPHINKVLPYFNLSTKTFETLLILSKKEVFFNKSSLSLIESSKILYILFILYT